MVADDFAPQFPFKLVSKDLKYAIATAIQQVCIMNMLRHYVVLLVNK